MPPPGAVSAPADLSSCVLLIGFGRFGQIASQPLLENGYTLSIIETSTQAIFDLEPLGFRVHYGDGTRLDILQAAGAHQARLIVVAIDDRQACLKIVEIAKAEFPHTPVLARAFDREHAIELIRADVDWQVRETVESALSLASRALELLEPDARVRAQVIDTVRQRDAERLAIQVREGLDAAPGLIRHNTGVAARRFERRCHVDDTEQR